MSIPLEYASSEKRQPHLVFDLDLARARIVFHSPSETGWTESRLPLRSSSMPASSGTVFKKGSPSGGSIGPMALIET